MNDEKLYPIKYDPKHYTIMANDIVRGKQDMSLQEARIIRLMVTQIVKEDQDLKTYTCNIKDLAKFLNISPNNLYRDIQNICTNLAQRIIKVGTGNPKQPWKIFQWISKAEYDGEGNITLKLSNDISEHVLELEKYFTQYQLENILEMHSFYAIRLYELLKSDEYKDQNYIEFSIEFLRSFFECEKKYAKFADFRINIIEISIKEINEKSDIEIRQIEYIKQGRKVHSIRFWIGYNFSTNHKKSLIK